MSPRTIATALATTRIAIGAALFIAPRTAGRMWVGHAADDAGGTMALRGLGARDVALGVGALLTTDDPASGPRWIEAGVAADTADLAAALLVAKDHETPKVVMTALAAGGAVATGLWLRGALSRAPA